MWLCTLNEQQTRTALMEQAYEYSLAKSVAACGERRGYIVNVASAAITRTLQADEVASKQRLS